MREKFYAELSRRLREKGIESSCAGTQNLNVLLHGQPVLFVAPSSEIFILPAGSQNEEVNDLYHRVGATADEVYEYVEAVQGAPLLHASDLKEEFRLLADFGCAVLAGRERENDRGYSDEEQDKALGTVGHLRMDFGSGGDGFHHSWWPHNEDRFNTLEFKESLQEFVDAMRQNGPL